MRRFVAFAAVLSFTTSLAAQTSCYGENTGPNFNNAVSMGGPWVGIKFTNPSNVTVVRAEVFSGEGTAQNGLALWTHDPINNWPAVSITQGTWTMTSPNAWQGAQFSTPATLAAATIYWLVWMPGGGCQAAVDLAGPTALTQQYRASTNNGSSWTGPFTFADRPWKFRFFCSAAPYQVNQSCASLDINGIVTNGSAPAVYTTTPGAPFAAIMTGLNGNPFDILYTLNTTLIPTGFVTVSGQIVNVNLAHPSLAFVFGGTFNNSFTTLAPVLSIATPATEIDAQLVILDPAHPEGFCLSQGSAARTL